MRRVVLRSLVLSSVVLSLAIPDRHIHRVAGMLTALLVAALLAPATVLAEEKGSVEHEQAAAELTAADQALPRWRGHWDSWGEVPVEPRTGAAVAVTPWMPHGAILWGGVAADDRLLNDGVMIDTGGTQLRSRVLPQAPLSPRRDFGWASWKDRVYVWGGLDQDGDSLDDGAEYGATLTPLPASPLPPGPASMVVVVERLWVVVRDPASGRARIASMSIPLGEYGGEWSPALDVPLPIGDRYDVVGCCTLGAYDVIILSRRSDGFASAVALHQPSSVRARTPGGAEWIQLGDVPVPPLPAAGPAVGRAIEQDLAAWAGSSDEPWPGSGETGTFGVLLSEREPAAGWRLTTPAPDGVGSDPALVLSPRHLISVEAMVAYDLVAETWLSLPAPDGRGRSEVPTGATAWWDQGKLWVFGGRMPDGSMDTELRTFEPRLPKGTHALPLGESTLWGGEPCYVIAEPETTWRLRGDPLDPALTWMQRGRRRIELTWPEGWTARFGPRLAIVDSTGRIRFREGQMCIGDTGTGG